jgi:hypothetical protein
VAFKLLVSSPFNNNTSNKARLGIIRMEWSIILLGKIPTSNNLGEIFRAQNHIHYQVHRVNYRLIKSTLLLCSVSPKYFRNKSMINSKTISVREVNWTMMNPLKKHTAHLYLQTLLHRQTLWTFPAKMKDSDQAKYLVRLTNFWAPVVNLFRNLIIKTALR